MIEINLSPTKKAGGITNVGGIDLSHINVRMMLIALIILFVPEGFVIDYYDEQIKENEKVFQKLNKEFREVSSKTRGMANIQKQVDALDEQEKKLARKLEAVKKIINKRSNPFKVLNYITENIPTDVWITSMDLDESKLVMRGHSKNWKSIGEFIQNLKNSIFFTKQVSYTRPPDMKNEVRGQRVEVFEITTSIVRFK